MPRTIAFDLRPLQIGHENRGIGMVIKSILVNLEDTENTYLFYVFDKSNPLKEAGITPRLKHYELVETPSLKTVVGSPKDIIAAAKLAYHKFHALKTHRPDVFVQFDFALGVPRWRHTKVITIAYDLIPLILKNEYLPGVTSAWNQANGKKAKIKAVIRSVFYTLKYKKYYSNYKASNQILSISEATKQSFIERLGIDAKKIHTLPLAPVSSTNQVDASISKTILKPYLFYIGGTDSRKRVEEIVYAFNIMKGRGHDISLVLAGNEFKKLTMLPSVVTRNAILDSPYRKDIHLVGFVTDAEKAGLYKNAAAFLFTSAYEGFGLPVVEAAAAGCPVVAYSNSSIPEAIGDAALLVETGDYTAAANAAISLLDVSSRDRIVKRGIKQTKKYSWEKFTAAFLDVLND